MSDLRKNPLGCCDRQTLLDKLAAQAATIAEATEARCDFPAEHGGKLREQRIEIERQAETIERLTALVWELRSIEFTRTLCAYTGKPWTRDKAAEFDAATKAMLDTAKGDAKPCH